MPAWLTLPLLVDLILVGMLCEAAWLVWRHRRMGLFGLPSFLLHVVSGLFLLLAMRLTLLSANFNLIAAVLGLAGICHLYDLQQDAKRKQ